MPPQGKLLFPQSVLMFAVEPLLHSKGAGDAEIELYRCARMETELRRRLSKLSCAGWLPHDRGFVLGLPLSK